MKSFFMNHTLFANIIPKCAARKGTRTANKILLSKLTAVSERAAMHVHELSLVTEAKTALEDCAPEILTKSSIASIVHKGQMRRYRGEVVAIISADTRTRHTKSEFLQFADDPRGKKYQTTG